MSKNTLPHGIVKACAGVVESVTEEPFRTYVTAAGRVVGVNYALDEAAQRERENLIEAIKYNLVNRYEYPYELLVRRYNLPVSLSTFKREKKKYCYEHIQEEKIRAKKIFNFTVLCSFLIYLYLAFKNSRKYYKAKFNNQDTSLVGIRFFASILIVIASSLLLTAQLNDKVPINPSIQ